MADWFVVFLGRTDRGRQEINIQNMNVELVAQMFKNYQSNVLFHLEGTLLMNHEKREWKSSYDVSATDSLKDPA